MVVANNYRASSRNCSKLLQSSGSESQLLQSIAYKVFLHYFDINLNIHERKILSFLHFTHR